MSPRRSGLGRGLDTLLPSQQSTPESRGGTAEIPIDSIEPNRLQPRERFDEESLDELASSIAQLGILQPLLVRVTSAGRYELIAGERRLRASRRAGLDSVPALVIETDDRGSLERALVENIHRENLNPIEEAAGYRELLDESGMTHEALAQTLGRNRVTITNALRLLDLSTDIQAMLIDGRLTAGHGRALLALEGNPFMPRLARRVTDDGLSVRETEELVRRYRAIGEPVEGRSRTKQQQSAAAIDAQRVLSDRLQTRVRVEMGKRKGKIVVEFVSPEELERLTAAIAGTGATTDRASADQDPSR